jgi:eukaryotic-like serine/threonine-protein kinase
VDALRWQRVSAVFDAVVDAPAGERMELLARLCADDAELRSEVEKLLAADAQATHFERGVDSARGSAAADWADTHDSRSAERVGPWRLLHELGRGGMGVVYLAERADGQFEQRAALKLIKRGMDSDAVLARFLRERQILARLEHPRIARLLDGGLAEDGRPYFAMEYVDGAPLLRHCAEKGARLEQRIRLFLDVCAAVQFAHGQLVVHRDIKPSNILVTAAGEAKLLDFGIAKLLDESAPGVTATVDALHRPLTPAYAAPEQLRGEPVTTATDIYALGCVLYELLAGRRPLALGDTPSPAEVLRMQDTTDPMAPSKVADATLPFASKRLRGDLDTIVLKALQREPQRRYATAEAFADDLRRYLAGQPIQARREHTWYRVGKFIRRHRVGVAATMLGALALISALALALWQAREKAREAETAQQVTQFLTGIFRGADPTLSRGATVTAQELIDQGAERLRGDATIAPAVRAPLLDTIASTYTALGLYDRALPPAQQALDLRRGDPAASSVDIAAALDQLGRIYLLKADYAQAEPLLRDALARRRAALPADDPAIIESLDHLGALASARGDYQAADGAFAEAFHSAERHFGGEAAETARYLDDYAANLDDLGRRVDALALYRRALAIREKALGPDDAEVATSLLSLGTHLDNSGQYGEATPLLERALVIRTKIFGAEHPLVGYVELELAVVYGDLNRMAEAEKHAQTALDVFRKTLPADHPKTLEALNTLVFLRVASRDYAAAATLGRDVLERFRSALGAGHPNTLAAENNLAYALMRNGQFAEAEQLQRAVIAQAPADNGPGTIPMDLQNLATTVEMQGRIAEGIALRRRAVDLQRRSEGDVSGNVAVALLALAMAEETNGDLADAERDFHAEVALGEQLHQKQNLDLHQWYLPYAGFLIGRGRCDEAVPLLDAVFAELKPLQPLRDPVPWQQARLLQGHCLVQTGHAVEGGAMQNEARAQLRALPGIEMDLCPTARKLLGVAASTKHALTP